MFATLNWLFDSGGFVPRWICGHGWTDEPRLGWLHIISDILIFAAYFTIPCILLLFGARRRNLPFRWIFWLFGIFIFACGATHLIEAIIFWQPIYRFAGLVKVVTAVASWGTVLALIPITPKALALRSPLELEREIREREIAEKTVRESEVRFRGLLEAAPDGMLMFDAEGRIVLANSQAQQLTAWTREALMTAKFSDLLPESAQNSFREFRRQFFQTPHNRRMGEGLELVLRRPDGLEVPVEVSLSPLQTTDGLLAIAAVRNITERRRIEQQMLQNERLVGIGQTVTGLAHEGRNALQQIQSCVELLRLQLAPNEYQATLLRTIEQSQDRLAHLFDEVRTYAAPLKVDIAQIEIAALIASAWQQLSSARNGRQASIQVSGDKHLHCQGDFYQLEQVFRNVFENSLAACPDPVEIHVSCNDSSLHGQPALSITACDNGPGIKPELRNQIFDPFFTTKTHGTGLGLAICKRIVQAHRGQIDVLEDPPRGAAVRVQLPLSHNHSANLTPL